MDKLIVQTLWSAAFLALAYVIYTLLCIAIDNALVNRYTKRRCQLRADFAWLILWITTLTVWAINMLSSLYKYM